MTKIEADFHQQEVQLQQYSDSQIIVNNLLLIYFPLLLFCLPYGSFGVIFIFCPDRKLAWKEESMAGIFFRLLFFVLVSGTVWKNGVFPKFIECKSKLVGEHLIILPTPYC